MRFPGREYEFVEVRNHRVRCSEESSGTDGSIISTTHVMHSYGTETLESNFFHNFLSIKYFPFRDGKYGNLLGKMENMDDGKRMENFCGK